MDHDPQSLHGPESDEDHTTAMGMEVETLTAPSVFEKRESHGHN